MHRRRLEDKIYDCFLAHVRDQYKKVAAQVVVDRLMSNQQLPMEIADEYSREWFKTIFNIRRTEPAFRITVGRTQLLDYLNKKYNPIVSEKIVDFIDIEEQISYNNFIERLRQKLFMRSHKD